MKLYAERLRRTDSTAHRHLGDGVHLTCNAWQVGLGGAGWCVHGSRFRVHLSTPPHTTHYTLAPHARRTVHIAIDHGTSSGIKLLSQPICHLAVIKETPVPRAEVPQPRAVVALGEFRPLPAVLRQHYASRAR